MKITAIILSAGRGMRLGSDIPKQYIEVEGKPLLCYCLESFEKSRTDSIVIVTAPGDEEYVRQKIVQKYAYKKVSCITAGGSERYYSVLNGLREAAGDYVLIHDGARPFITTEGINLMIDAVSGCDAAIAAQPSRDTIKITDEDGFVTETTDRRHTWNVQTPQCFRYDLILEAYERIIEHSENEDLSRITDDAMVFESAFPERKVRLTDPGCENMKITTQSDLEYMRWRLSESHR